MAEQDAELEDQEEEHLGPDDDEGDDEALDTENEDPDSELEADDDSEDPPEQEEEPRRQQRRAPNRGEKRFQTLANRNRELEREVARLSGGFEAITRAGTAQSSEAQRREEEERLAAMDPEQRAEYRINKGRDQVAQIVGQAQFRTDDRLDKSDFKALCRDNDAYQEVAEEVEAELGKLHRMGQRVDREIIANNLIGKRAAEKRAAAKEKDRQKLQRQQRKETGGRPNRGGSDVQQPRGRERKGKSAADRLANVKF